MKRPMPIANTRSDQRRPQIQLRVVDAADLQIGDQRLGDETEALRPARQRADHGRRREQQHHPSVRHRLIVGCIRDALFGGADRSRVPIVADLDPARAVRRVVWRGASAAAAQAGLAGVPRSRRPGPLGGARACRSNGARRRTSPGRRAVAGLGWSSPVVADGRVWLTTAVEQRGVSLRALAFDVATGRKSSTSKCSRSPPIAATSIRRTAGRRRRR